MVRVRSGLLASSSLSTFLIIITIQDYGMLRFAHLLLGISYDTGVVFRLTCSGFFEEEDPDRAFETLNFVNITMIST